MRAAEPPAQSQQARAFATDFIKISRRNETVLHYTRVSRNQGGFAATSFFAVEITMVSVTFTLLLLPLLGLGIYV